MIDRRVDGAFKKNYPKPESEKKALRTIIEAINPDILLLQEIGDDRYLKELQSDLKAEGLNFPYATLCPGTDLERHIALLSKEPFKEIKHNNCISYMYLKGIKNQVRRGILEVEFDTNGTEWTLYGVHLKSKLTSSKEDFKAHKQRLAEATAIKNFIKKEGKEFFFLAGDFNDSPKTKSLARFYKPEASPLTEMLPTTDSRGESWTQHNDYQSCYETVDYILASPKIANKVKEHKVNIVDHPLALQASDHRMLYLDADI